MSTAIQPGGRNFGGALPLNAVAGIDSMWIYNNLVLNDRRYPDQYRITNIDGIGDPDIRDGYRSSIAQSSGEQSFQSFYDGRTITLTGKMQAGNLNKIRAMQQALRTAFQSTVELPLYVRAGRDYNDDFAVDRLTTDYFFDQGTPTVSGGVFNVTANTRTLAVNSLFDNGRATIKFTTAASLPAAANRYGVILKRTAPSGKCLVAFVDFRTGANNSTIGIGFHDDAGTFTAIATNTLTTTLATATSYWMVVKVNNDVVTLEFWTATPTLLGTPAFTFNNTISTNATAGLDFGTTKKGISGLYANPNATPFITMDDFLLEPAGVFIGCRKNQALSIKEAVVNGGVFWSDFLVTLRASDPRFYDVFRKASTLAFISATTANATLSSSGNFLSEPIFRLGNAGTSVVSPTISNLTRAETMSFSGTILTGTSIYFELNSSSQNKYLRDQTGSSKWSFFSAGGIIPFVQPGANSFQIANATINGAPTCQFEWRDCWI